MTFSARVLFLTGLSLTTFAACSEPGDSNSGGGGSSTTTPIGGGGAGGAGGSVSPSAKPVCTDPGSASGPTPDPRADTAGALSADGASFVIFGGDTATVICGDAPAHTHAGDTWLLDTACGGWTKIESPGPSARSRHAVALDPASNRALLFGGRFRAGSSGAYTLYNDVWSFDFPTKTWTEVATTGTPPSKRSNTAAAVVNGKLVVYGGNSSTSGLTFTPLADAFVLDLATNAWSKLDPAGAAPKARLFHAMAAHPSKDIVYVHSGGDANAFTGPFFTDTWSLDVATGAWTELATDTPDGTGRIKLGLWATVPEGAADPSLFVFGGHDDGKLGNRNDILTGPVTATLTLESLRPGDTFNKSGSGACSFPTDFTTLEEGSPERRSAFAVAALPDGSAAVVFGGDSDCGRLSDAHWYDAVNNTWTPIRATLPGLVCLRTGSTTCTSLCN